jgi:hypothetical protein
MQYECGNIWIMITAMNPSLPDGWPADTSRSVKTPR